jgi:single-stranded DNA-binding protein
MISHVMIIGEIDEVVSDNTRFIKVQRPYRNAHGIFSEDKFPIQYWSKATNNYFMNMKMGTLIAIKGRLEFVESLGVMIICDFLESLHLPLAK